MFEILVAFPPPTQLYTFLCISQLSGHSCPYRSFIKPQGELDLGAKGPSVIAFVGPNVQERVSEFMLSGCFFWPADDREGPNHNRPLPNMHSPGPRRNTQSLLWGQADFSNKVCQISTFCFVFFFLQGRCKRSFQIGLEENK